MGSNPAKRTTTSSYLDAAIRGKIAGACNGSPIREWLAMLRIIGVIVLLAVGGAIALAIEPALPERARDWISDKQGTVVERGNQLKEIVSNEDRTAPAKNISSTRVPVPSATTQTVEPEGPRVGGVLLSELTAGKIFAMERQGLITETEAAEALQLIKSPGVLATVTPTRPIPTSPAPTATLAAGDPRLYMLALINRDRSAAGLSQISLGENTAAQEHADEMLEYSYLSQWGLDGMKPYMRYALAGGTSGNAENVSGVDAPRKPGVRYRPIESVESELDEAQTGLMNSLGHRRNILNTWHKKVNLGIACNDFNCAVVQQFEGKYVEFNGLPRFELGVLTVSGRIFPPFTFDQIGVWYERPPNPLSLGQLDITHCYSIGDSPVAFVVPPLPPNSFYPADDSLYEWTSCRDPYLADPGIPRNEPLGLGEFRLSTLTVDVAMQVPAPWVTAQQWQVTDSGFTVRVDLSDVLDESGAGVYTVIVWGESDGETVNLTAYPIFVE